MRHLACAVLFIIGVFSGNCGSPPEMSPVKSNCPQSVNYSHCHSSKEGIHDLDCYTMYIQQSDRKTNCVWKPGRQSSNMTTYTLIIEQKDRNFCTRYENISKTTHLFYPFEQSEMTVYVIDASSDERNCMMATFTGIPENLVRCGPPASIIFQRNSSQLEIKVSWAEKRKQTFIVKYRELNSLPWKQVDSHNKTSCLVSNLTALLFYEVKVKCVTNQKCRQCPWSNVAIVPPELTSTPIIEKFDVTPQKMGKRSIVTHWKLANNESVDSYRVLVRKVSGEFSQTLYVTQPILRLILSGSAYYIDISARNSAGFSPPAHRMVPTVTSAQDWDLNGNLNVTVSNSEFEISWNHSLTQTYCCYSVEWGLRGEKMSFHSLHRKNSNHDIISLKDPLQPYKRYVFLLHTRPDKDTCNLKSINDSESTAGRTEAYAKEGTPISAPGNITCLEVTSTSLVIAWRPVSEEAARGFLLGYTIHYTENGKEQNTSVVIDSAGVDRCTLSNLKSQTAYEVQLSAFTAVGQGVRSTSLYFETTNSRGYQTVAGAVAGIAVTVFFLLLGANLSSSVVCKRAKELFWPSIPNPGNSNAIQKIDGAFELEVLEPLRREQQAQESDTSSLLIIEGIAETLPAPACLSSLPGQEELPRAGSPAEEETPPPSPQAGPSPVAMATGECRATPPPAVSDYTTMELFQQIVARPPARPQPPGPSEQPQEPQRGPTVQDYIRQATCLPYPSERLGFSAL
ncbi:hypothetical protein COCON_G00169270 [Conger conger]|uniref:Fibronectin type-III domain-containing protein n=1 Tax=Conger conger TaxID=82655 RepID=A0A9Q1D885_CONCO|nr:hypothetical protein COCON_G00169270 [Conger conger]